MKLACCVWALTLPENEILQEVKNIDFEWIDIQPQMLRSAESHSIANSLGLNVSCVGASFRLPDGSSLDDIDANQRQQAIKHVFETIEHASEVGADTIYVVPGVDNSIDALERYALSVQTIADKASKYDLKIGIEHFPGRALSTARETLAFIRQINHPNLYLLFDSGHVQMSGEDPAEVILEAGSKLGYVHLDDNDGKNDLHWSLLDGVMTQESLNSIFQALDTIHYTGAISLELSPRLSNPALALRQSREIVLKQIDF